MGNIIEVSVPPAGSWVVSPLRSQDPIVSRFTEWAETFEANPNIDPELVMRFEEFALRNGVGKEKAFATAVRLANVDVDWVQFDKEMGLTGEI